MPRFVALTGSCGFIGRVVTRMLLERGDLVYGVDSLTYAADPDANRMLMQLYPERYSFVGASGAALGTMAGRGRRDSLGG